MAHFPLGGRTAKPRKKVPRRQGPSVGQLCVQVAQSISWPNWVPGQGKKEAAKAEGVRAKSASQNGFRGSLSANEGRRKGVKLKSPAEGETKEDGKR